ncbi:hypothetical protein B9Z65_2762 [Elsinoe australis]|uniref:Uncharacterized protein n=1 Tax=Elsinoe australis TaxID=40998 RepID=A0A2P8A4H8_9PEZI|nr:hypothetical protein B9Z65_2762 [Elsinoe australis]
MPLDLQEHDLPSISNQPNHTTSTTGNDPSTLNPPTAHDPAPSTTSAASTPPLPSLEYKVLTRSRIIFMVIFWSLVITDSVFMPIALYFGLWYGTDLSPNTVFSIVTAAIGGVSILEYFLRFWRLFKKGSTCRVIGGRRAYLDWFHWVFTATWVVLMVELIIGSTPDNPPIRLLAMPPSSLLYVFGLQLCVFEGMRWGGVKSPVRVSSQPRGSVLLPGAYNLVEDIVAVDGSGGTEYRERLWKRYQASKVFRVMLEKLTLFWGMGCLAMATLTTILIFTLEGDYAYAVGWSAPFLWAAIWAAMTWWYVERSLRVERETWGRDVKP